VQGAIPVAQPFGGTLTKKQASSQNVTLLGGRCYTLLGVDGDGVKDLDLYFYDQNSKKVASDLGFDALPALTSCPTWPGQHRVEIVLKDGGGDVAAQLFVAPIAASALINPPPANPSPDPRTQLIEQVAQTMPPATRIGDFYRGAGKDNEHSDFTIPLAAGHCYLFYGAAAPSMRALSLYIWDPSDKRVADQKGVSTSPMIQYCPMKSGPFHVQGKVVTGSGDYRMAVYALPPQPEIVAMGSAPVAGGDPLTAAVIAQAPSLAPGLCPTMPGPFHLQAKIEKGQGEYRMGVFKK
jgi:hypothetical protein